MAVLLGERALRGQERRLDDQQVDAGGELEGGVAQAGVHDEGGGLAGPGDAALGERDAAYGAGALELADLGAADAVGREPVGEHAAAGGLLDAVAVRLDGVGQTAGGERADGGEGSAGDGVFLDDVGVGEGGGVPEPRQ